MILTGSRSSGFDLKMEQPNIYDYDDYRIFLADMYNYMKSTKQCFSYRFFAKKAGFSSPNFLKLAIQNKRNLTHVSIPKIAKGFNLRGAERKFFENLVLMNQAASHEERDHYYYKMVTLRHRRESHFLEKEKYDYFSKWYYPVIREIVSFNSRELSPQQISLKLDPEVKVKEVENALDLLLKLNLIKEDSNGHWRQTNKAITTGPRVQSVIAANFHKEMMKLAVDSINRFPCEMRDISALILSVRRESIPQLKKLLANFRQELIDVADADNDPDIVVEINMQLFPISK